MMTLILTLLLMVLPNCATEDATNCVWDASTQGNGQGTSFIALGNEVIYF